MPPCFTRASSRRSAFLFPTSIEHHFSPAPSGLATSGELACASGLTSRGHGQCKHTTRLRRGGGGATTARRDCRFRLSPHISLNPVERRTLRRRAARLCTVAPPIIIYLEKLRLARSFGRCSLCLRRRPRRLSVSSSAPSL